VTEFLKSVKISQSYCQKFRGLVFLEHGVVWDITCDCAVLQKSKDCEERLCMLLKYELKLYEIEQTAK